jgi:hypothetical protein
MLPREFQTREKIIRVRLWQRCDFFSPAFFVATTRFDFRIVFGASPKISSSLEVAAEATGATAFEAIRRAPGINESEFCGLSDPHLGHL